MGGIGKTTLVKNLNNELEQRGPARDFGVIIWVTVSKETSVSRIQMQVAERLKMEVGMGQSEERMSVRLHERLRNEKRFLLILDDVWEAVDLDLVGIPRQEISSRGKIVITSRSLDVCREMETQVDLKVEALNPEEAWNLFCERAGEVALEERIRPIAKVVANECDGLPLAIIVVGASMRGKSVVSRWETQNSIRYGSFASLKVLRISDCADNFQASTSGCADAPSFDLLPNLEVLYLLQVHELESISDLSKILGLRFSKLRFMIIQWCDKFKGLLRLEENQTLENIKMVAVTNCQMLERLFEYPIARQHMDLDPILPNLETVRLHDLPNLENLCGDDECWPNLQVVDVQRCNGIKKLPLNVQNRETIKEIRGAREWWEQLQWDCEDTKVQLQNRFRCP
ncbi:disease resistance protein-like [Dorcoceras hygrometricum]|uniref:Disease resistance protein-like n=1 Tax=Dorcoceras hygrometricum TaxID=472368 RepID=A0A2Z7ATR7_9LAMI|nr:disease resistance protein-like [Dorcoceras hygrometricum]